MQIFSPLSSAGKGERLETYLLQQNYSLQGKEDYSMPQDTLFALSTAQSVPMSGVEVEELFPHAVKP